VKEIFVFGSNLAGRHGLGSASHAVRIWGAIMGVGEGIQGRSYGIPTKDEKLVSRSLPDIEKSVKRFIEYATAHPELTFRVVRIGCGLAGKKEVDIAPMFATAPPNCLLPTGWRV
jgi:hypothetical protein